MERYVIILTPRLIHEAIVHLSLKFPVKGSSRMQRSLFAFGLMSSLIAYSAASAEDFQQGQLVFLKLNDKSGSENKLIESNYFRRPSRIEKVDVDRLLVDGCWVQKALVLSLDRAIPYYTDVLKADPKNVEALNRRGAAWRNKGNLQKAIEDWTTAIQLEPACWPAFCNRGLAHTDMDELDSGIADYSMALKLAPNGEARSFSGCALSPGKRRAKRPVPSMIAQLVSCSRRIGRYFTKSEEWAIPNLVDSTKRSPISIRRENSTHHYLKLTVARTHPGRATQICRGHWRS